MEYCQSREVKKAVFFSQRNSVQTVMVSVPLDVLKQYFGISRKNGPVVGAQFLSPSCSNAPVRLLRVSEPAQSESLHTTYWSQAHPGA